MTNRRAKLIFVDGARLSASHFTGVTNFVSQALLAWAESRPDTQFQVVSHAPFNATFAAKTAVLQNLHLEVAPAPLSFPAAGAQAGWFYTYLPRLANRAAPDLYWAPTTLVPFGLSRHTKVLSTVYDLVPILYRDTMSLKGRIIFALSYRYSIRRANRLWTISNYVRDSLLRQIPEARDKPMAVACAVDHQQYRPLWLTPEQKCFVRRRYLQNYEAGKVLLFVGTVEPRKNLSFLLSLMPELAKEGFHLVIIGASGWGKALNDEARKIVEALPTHITFAGRINNDELTELYNTADLFVSTSMDEGFCLPAVEAMACGLQVLLADNSAMSEVAANGENLVAGWSKQTWCDRIKRFNHQKNDVINHAQQYDWKRQINRLSEV